MLRFPAYAVCSSRSDPLSHSARGFLRAEPARFLGLALDVAGDGGPLFILSFVLELYVVYFFRDPEARGSGG